MIIKEMNSKETIDGKSLSNILGQLSLFTDEDFEHRPEPYNNSNSKQIKKDGRVIDMKKYKEKAEWDRFYQGVEERIAHLIVYDKPETPKAG